MLKMKSKKLIAILLSVLMSGLIPAAVTLANDVLIGDADGVLVVNNGGQVGGSHNTTLEYQLQPGTKKSFPLSLALVDSGADKDNVTFPVNGSATLTSNPGGASFPTTPWTLNNYISVNNIQVPFQLEVTAPTQPGTYTYVVTFTATNNIDNLKSSFTTASIIVTVPQPVTVPDTTKPTLAYKLTPAAPDGENGWYTQPVLVEFEYSDNIGGSGINSTTAPASYTLSTDGIHPSKEVTVSDNSGNTQTVTVPAIKIDATAPTLTHTLSPENPNGNNGWYTSPVAVTFTADDPTGGSGLDPDSLPKDFTISDDGPTPSDTYSVKDMAGNIGTTTVPEIRLDKTNPEISGAATTLPNGNDWYNDDVTIRYTFSDATSGISDGATSFEETLSDEGANQSSTHTVSDVAGNSATASVSGINIDKTKPTITFHMPVEGASYKLNEVIFADWSASDTLSGIDFTTPDMTGTPLDTSSIGPKSFTVAATDKAGNTESITVNYKVIYDFDGFFQPVNMDGLNSAKAGSPIPIKFSLHGDMGLDILLGAPKAYTYSANVADELSAVDTVTAGQSSLSYDPINDQYTYVWKTDKSWARSAKQFAITLNDGTVHYAYFSFK